MKPGVCDIFWLATLFLLPTGCVIDPVCYSNADCPANQICAPQSANNGERKCTSGCDSDTDCGLSEVCDKVTGLCIEAECQIDADCQRGYLCEAHYCKSNDTLVCPQGMVIVDQSFCIDTYEASRPDATDTFAGSDESFAESKAGVLPWQVDNNAAAQIACEAAGKSLCSADQWYRACIGPQQSRYSYGNEYEPVTCNGIDTFCHCDRNECSEEARCPFPFCYKTCGASYHLTPTGSFPDCTNGYGVLDMNGNLWEHTRGGSSATVRGGAFNCSDSGTLHQCSYIPGWTPTALGFRCCVDAYLTTDTDAEDTASP